ncbi:adenylate/guanylate cyclase domain-containing protein [Oceanithermus sp.]
MRCPSCGYRNPDEFRFCGKCGSPLAGEAVLEKRWATILFYDVTGYSTFTLEHDLEVTHRELDALLQHCRRCVNLHGGQIDKFFGDGMLAVFGASDSRENEPLKALKAAVCMVKKLKHTSLRGRAGIATGIVMLGPLGGTERTHQTVIGEAVNLAQRMVSSAPAGTIWLDENTSRLVPEARLRDLGPKWFKGFGSAQRVWEFNDWGGKPEPLFGRQAELEKLLDFLDDASNGRGGVITIAGPLGIGKSFLINEAFRLRSGRIKPIFIPKLDVGDPVRRRLRAAFFDNFGPRPMEFLERLGLGELDRRLLAYALGMENERPAPLDELEAALVGTMRRALALISGSKPLVLVAQTGPRDHTLVRAMIRSLEEAPIPGIAAILQRRQPETGADVILGPLPRRDADAFMKYLKPSLDEEQRRAIFAESRGNPLLIKLLSLSDEPTNSVMAAFQSRLDKLPPSHRQTLLYAALGRPATWLGVLRELVGPDAREAVSHLISEGYLKKPQGGLYEQRRLEVANPLLHRVAGYILSASERRAVHRAYWSWLSKQDEQRLSAVAAEHALLAGLKDEAGKLWLAAGDYQRDFGIFTGAEAHYRRAAEEAGGEVRAAAIRRLAELHLKAGSAETVIELLRGEQSTWAERLRGLALAALNKTAAARGLLQSILERDPNDSHVKLALISLLPESERLVELKRLKKILDREKKPSEIRPFVNLRLAEAMASDLELEKAINIMREAYQGFVALHNRSRAAEAALAISGYMWHLERLAAASEWADKAIEHGRKAHPGVATIAWSVRAALWLDQARPAEAENALDQAEVHLEHARDTNERARIHAIRMRFYIETGRFGKALELGEEVYATLPHPWIAANLALAHALRGGKASELRQTKLTDAHAEAAPAPGKVLFLLAKALRAWREGQDPKLYLKASLKLGRSSGPYLRYLTLVLWSIFLIEENPLRSRSLAQYLQRRSSSGGFVAVNQTARLIRAELSLAAGEPIAHLLRFETPFGPQKAWRRSLLVRAGIEDPSGSQINLSGYGILGAWARLSWREVVRSRQDGSS